MDAPTERRAAAPAQRLKTELSGKNCARHQGRGIVGCVDLITNGHSPFVVSQTVRGDRDKQCVFARAIAAPRHLQLGFHPQLAHQRRNELPLFGALLPETRYVGEIGLDGDPQFRRYWDSQVSVFEYVLMKCSEAGGRIMSLHSRRASGAVLDYIEKFPDAGTPILHWFSGGFRDLDRAIKLGCWFSVGPAMLASKNGRTLAARMPRERVLTESDGPFAHINGEPARTVARRDFNLWAEYDLVSDT